MSHEDPFLRKLESINDQLLDMRRDMKYRRVNTWTIAWGVFWGLVLWVLITTAITWLMIALFWGAIVAAGSQAVQDALKQSQQTPSANGPAFP